MAKTRQAKNSAVVAVGVAVDEHASPLTGGDAVHIVGVDGGIPVSQFTVPWVTRDVSDGNIGGAFPGNAIAIGVQSAGGNLVPITLGQTTPALSVPVTQAASAAAFRSLADQAATGAAVALGNLAAGPGGLLVSSLPTSTPGSVVRVSGSDVAVNQGTPLAPGGSFVISGVQNANQLFVISQVAGGTISVTQV